MIAAPVGSGRNPSHGVLCSNGLMAWHETGNGKCARIQIADSAGGRISNVLG